MLIDDGTAVAVLTNQDAVGAAPPLRNSPRRSSPAIRSRAPEQQALDIYRGLQQGRIDRSLLAPNLSDYFTPEALADFQSSLAPLGEPLSLHQPSRELRGGMTFRAFDITYPGRQLELTTYTYPDGKLEQYLIAPGVTAGRVTRDAESACALAKRRGRRALAGDQRACQRAIRRTGAPRRVYLRHHLHQPVHDSSRPRPGWTKRRPACGNSSSVLRVTPYPSAANMLDAVFVEPAAIPPRASVLLCHGIGETVEQWFGVQQLLAANGVASLVFDYSGYGKSTGRPDWEPVRSWMRSPRFGALQELAPALPSQCSAFRWAAAWRPPSSTRSTLIG